jgi:hypothetical protein
VPGIKAPIHLSAKMDWCDGNLGYGSVYASGSAGGGSGRRLKIAEQARGGIEKGRVTWWGAVLERA